MRKYNCCICKKSKKRREFYKDKYRSSGISSKCKKCSSRFCGREYSRERARARDNYTCQICLRKWKTKERRFDVHHLNGICGKKSRAYDSIKDIKDLITLCHKCHLGLAEVRRKMKKKKGKRHIFSCV